MPALQKSGFAALSAVIFVVAVSTMIVGTLAFVALREAKITRNVSQSVRSFDAADAGVEDATYRFITSKTVSASETFATGLATGTITVATLGSQKTITAEVLAGAVNRNVQVVIQQQGSPVGFSYGAQVGNGGLTLGDGSSIIGDVFSNGDIVGNGATKSTITGTAQAAGSSAIKKITIDQNAYAHTLSDCTVYGKEYYVTAPSNCTASSTAVMTQDLAPLPFPISQSQIDAWKNDAAAGGTISGYTLGNNTSGSLGPKKVSGDISLGNSSTLTLTGTVWITGTINFGNNDIIQLASSYGTDDGILLTDGSVSIGNGAVLQGSGQGESYLMLLSTYGPGKAIDLGNNASSSIFYAPNGTIDIGNGLFLREATGYGLDIGNSSSVQFQQGLLNLNFTSGSTTNWIVKSWKEVQ